MRHMTVFWLSQLVVITKRTTNDYFEGLWVILPVLGSWLLAIVWEGHMREGSKNHNNNNNNNNSILFTFLTSSHIVITIILYLRAES